MFQRLKIYSAKKSVNGFLKGNKTSQAHQVDKMAVILDLDIVSEDFDLTDLREDLGFSYETFDFIICSKQKNSPEKYSLEHFDDNNLGWKAKFIEGSKEKGFQETNYKMLLNYYLAPSPELLVLSASVKANLKVGFPLAEKRLNNLEIDVDPKNHRLFIKELKKYMAMMKN